MKYSIPAQRLLLILVAPLFIYGLCNSDDGPELPDNPNTDEYFTWRIPGYNGNLTSPPDSVTYTRINNNNIFVAYNSSGSLNSYVSFTGAQTTGSFSTNQLIIYTNGKYYVSSTSPIAVDVTTFGGPGQHILGSYAGTIRDSANSNTFSVTGNFKVRNQ